MNSATRWRRASINPAGCCGRPMARRAARRCGCRWCSNGCGAAARPTCPCRRTASPRRPSPPPRRWSASTSCRWPNGCLATPARPDIERNAATLARWILKERPDEVHVRRMLREVRLPGLRSAEQIKAAAKVLVDADWLRAPVIGFGAAEQGRLRRQSLGCGGVMGRWLELFRALTGGGPSVTPRTPLTPPGKSRFPGATPA